MMPEAGRNGGIFPAHWLQNESILSRTCNGCEKDGSRGKFSGKPI
jgi:hypothetical protein